MWSIQTEKQDTHLDEVIRDLDFVHYELQHNGQMQECVI